MTNVKRSKKTDISTVLMALALICLMAGGYVISRKKLRMKEAVALPFYRIEMSEVVDGEYSAKTYTSFLHLQLKVIVENHKIKDILVLENEGLDGETAKPIIQEMIAKNSTIVPAIKKAELGSLVYISCASSALSQSQNQEN